MSPLIVELLCGLLLLAGVGLSLAGLPGPLLAVLSLFIAWQAPVWPWLGTIELIVLIVLLLAGEFAEQAGGFVGMKWTGIHSLGWKMAVIGALVGLAFSLIFLNPLIIIIGMIGGAWVGEIMEGENAVSALKVAVGFGLGKFGGYLVKNVITTSVILYLLLLRLWAFLESTTVL